MGKREKGIRHDVGRYVVNDGATESRQVHDNPMLETATQSVGQRTKPA